MEVDLGLCPKWVQLTLLAPACFFPGCSGEGWNPPPLKKSYLWPYFGTFNYTPPNMYKIEGCMQKDRSVAPKIEKWRPF